MPDLTRISCSRCGQSVFNCMIDGADGQPHRVPVVTRINAGQPEDTGPLLDVYDPNIRMTSFTREFMQSRVARIELCEACLSEFMGWPLVSASEDPMFVSARANSKVQRAVDEVFDDPSIDKTARFNLMHARAFHAAHVAWNEAAPEDLQVALQPKDDTPELPLAKVSVVDLAKLGLQRIAPVPAPVTGS